MAKDYSLGTPHSSDLLINGKKISWNSFGVTNFINISAFFKSKNRDYAGSSLPLQSLIMDGQTYSLNSVVVRKLSFSIIFIIAGSTFTDREGTFNVSNSNGIIFFTKDFLSNFSRIRDIPFRNYTLFEWSF